jgi:hypothetical protein
LKLTGVSRVAAGSDLSGCTFLEELTLCKSGTFRLFWIRTPDNWSLDEKLGTTVTRNI